MSCGLIEYVNMLYVLCTSSQVAGRVGDRLITRISPGGVNHCNMKAWSHRCFVNAEIR